MLCWFLPQSNPNQSQLYTHTHTHALLSLPYLSRSTRLGHHSVPYWAPCVSRDSGAKQLWVLRTCAHFLPSLSLSFPICVMGTMMASKRCHRNTVKEGLYRAWEKHSLTAGLKKKKKKWPGSGVASGRFLGLWGEDSPHCSHQQYLLSTGFLAQPTETVCANPAGVCVLRVCVCD